jgi:hypothetical protein
MVLEAKKSKCIVVASGEALLHPCLVWSITWLARASVLA